MRRCFLLFFIFITTGSVNAQNGKKNITLDDLWKNRTFALKDVPGFNAMKDGLHYTQIESEGKHQKIKIYNLETGKEEKTIFDNELQKYNGNTINIDEYSFSNDEQLLLLRTESENIYRRSVLHRVYIYDINAGKIKLIDNDKVLHDAIAPNGQYITYIKYNNLFCKSIKTDEIIKISDDGVKNKIINGNCDWVYEEEFGFSKAYFWSPDGNYIAYYRFDETLVPEFTIAKYTGLYPEEYTYKYPKAGERNSIIQIKIFDLRTKKTTNADIGKETDIYIPRIKWTTKNNELCIFRMNRYQNKLDYLLTNVETGNSTIAFTDENKYYINIDDEITFLPDGHSMIYRSEKDGYSHLFIRDWTNQKEICLTSGNYDVDNLVGIDINKKLVYYVAAETSPLERNLYVVNLKASNKKCLTPEKGYHSITPCVGYHYFLDKYTTINSVPQYYLRNNEGKIIRTLEDNHLLAAKMQEYSLGKLKLTTVKGKNELLNAWIITPPDFDSTKKYPVLLYQYSGPGSQEVADKFPVGNFFWHQLLAEKGYIIVCADGTGTGFRGEAFRKKTYLELGKYESEDQIAVAQNLSELPYIDKNRIGIWGWSFGGFMSSNCILKGNDVFKMAIAVAPVTNWRYYDNIYTERYMRTPAENAKGYDENAPEKIADKLKGKFLFIHGTADDNVHFQNATMLATAFIKADKDYDSEYYPDKAHGISGGNTRLHLYRRMTDFILHNL